MLCVELVIDVRTNIVLFLFISTTVGLHSGALLSYLSNEIADGVITSKIRNNFLVLLGHRTRICETRPLIEISSVLDCPIK